MGRAVVSHLADKGYYVFVFDRAAVRDGNMFAVELTDYGQMLDAVLGLDGVRQGIDAIVHLAAVPAPGIIPDIATFRNNMQATYHVLEAARRANVKRVVTA